MSLEPLPLKCLLKGMTRSEEHTSELQSRFDLVCRLLLEKKKTNNSRFSHLLLFSLHFTFLLCFLSFNTPVSSTLYTLSLHDALPIYILYETIAPAHIPEELADKAKAAASRLAEKINVIGTFAIEMFVKGDDKIGRAHV